MNEEALAWYKYPEPDGKRYSEEELLLPQIVEELFDYCQILLASISAKGWCFLIDVHGIDGLEKIDTQQDDP